MYKMLLDSEWEGNEFTAVECGEDGVFYNIDNVGYIAGELRF